MSTVATLLKLAMAFNPNLPAEQEQCVTRVVYHESRGEDLIGQYLVARVVRNRVLDPTFPSTPCEVVEQKGQFSGNKPIPVVYKPHEMLLATLAARMAFQNESYIPQVDGIFWFTQVGENSVFHSKLIKSFTHGGHTFFRQASP